MGIRNRLAELNDRQMGVVFFFTALFLRLLYSWQVVPLIHFRWISANIDRRALHVLRDESTHMLAAWGSYHVPLAFFYRLLDAFDRLEYRHEALAVLNSFLGAATVVIFFLITTKVFPRWRPLQLVLTFCYLCYYPAISFVPLVLSETLFMPVFMALFLVLFDIKEKQALRSFFLGLLFGICLITRPLVLTFLPFLLLWLYSAKRWSLTALTFHFFLPFLLAASLIVFPTAAVNSNHERHGRFSITDNGGVNFTITWCQPRRIEYKLSSGERFWFSSPVFWERSRSTDISTEVPFYQQGYYYQRGLQCILDNPHRLITNIGNVFRVFHSNFYPQYISHPLHTRLLILWKIIAPLLLLGFLLFPLLTKSRRKEWLLALFLLLSLAGAVYLSNPGEERYLVPYFFVLFLWGGAGLWRACKKIEFVFFWCERSFYKVSIGVMALLVAGSLLFLLRGDGVAPESPFTEKVRRAELAAAKWLVGNQREDGSFVYRLDTKKLEEIRDENIVRQLIASHGLANAARRHGGEGELQQAHQRNLKFLTALVAKGDGDYSYVKSASGPSRLNAAVFALLTLIDSPFSQGYWEEIKRLAEFVLVMQRADGSFLMLYPLDANEGVDEKAWHRMERFASGEAALACVLAFERLRDQRFLHCARQAFRHYSPRITSNLNDSYASWHTIAYSRLYQIERRREYLETINILTDHLIRQQNPEDGEGDKVPGGFDQRVTWWTSAEAVFTEAIGYAARVNRKWGFRRYDRYNKANRLGLENLVHFQFAEDSPDRLRGGIQCERDVYEIYADNNGHALMTFDEYLRAVERWGDL